jgi:hypothetical protein
LEFLILVYNCFSLPDNDVSSNILGRVWRSRDEAVTTTGQVCSSFGKKTSGPWTHGIGSINKGEFVIYFIVWVGYKTKQREWEMGNEEWQRAI